MGDFVHSVTIILRTCASSLNSCLDTAVLMENALVSNRMDYSKLSLLDGFNKASVPKLQI